jgi:adenosylcobinamide kinase/adenosylcobinamide-phosphate guanylyltransferase
MRERIARHRAERPAHWTTVEEPLALAWAVRQARPEGATVLVDCVTVWLGNLTWEHRESEQAERERVILEEVADFARAARGREVIAVSNEVGSGIVPEHPLGRSFRDLQGLANQKLAEEAAGVVLLFAGLPLVLKGR